MINVPYNLIKGISKPRRIQLVNWCNHRYNFDLKKRQLSSYGMASLYSTILNVLMDRSHVTDDTEIMPNNSFTLMLGIDLNEELLVALRHSQLILGTDNKQANQKLRNTYIHKVNLLNPHKLYIFNINQGISSVQLASYANFVQWIKNIITALSYDINK